MKLGSIGLSAWGAWKLGGSIPLLVLLSYSIRRGTRQPGMHISSQGADIIGFQLVLGAGYGRCLYVLFFSFYYKCSVKRVAGGHTSRKPTEQSSGTLTITYDIAAVGGRPRDWRTPSPRSWGIYRPHSQLRLNNTTERRLRRHAKQTVFQVFPAVATALI
ncbi:hypothetical protein F4802DRAFT_32280 [Xylaria palmicola]|nr:hypothetical protein F4802DRAFT_32280 [Xylaria palmicola]